MILEVRTAHAERSGWHPNQVGYLTIKVHTHTRPGARSYAHVLLSDRDIETGACVAGLNTRVFCYIDRATGDIIKVSQGRVLRDARGSIFNDASVRRAITPFGIESR